MVNLNPELATQVIRQLSAFTDEELLSSLKECYNIIGESGDNRVTEGVREKLEAFASMYNSVYIPVANKYIATLKDFTDVAEYLNALNVNSDVKAVQTSEIKDNTMRDLLHV